MHDSHGFGCKTSGSSVTSQLALDKEPGAGKSGAATPSLYSSTGRGEGAGEGVGRTQGLTEYRWAADVMPGNGNCQSQLATDGGGHGQSFSH